MLDSKAVAAVLLGENNEYILCIREHWLENLGHYAFRRHLKRFKTEAEAMMVFKKTYPLGKIVLFDQLTRQ